MLTQSNFRFRKAAKVHEIAPPILTSSFHRDDNSFSARNYQTTPPCPLSKSTACLDHKVEEIAVMQRAQLMISSVLILLARGFLSSFRGKRAIIRLGKGGDDKERGVDKACFAFNRPQIEGKAMTSSESQRRASTRAAFEVSAYMRACSPLTARSAKGSVRVLFKPRSHVERVKGSRENSKRYSTHPPLPSMPSSPLSL